ncbi:pinensin family lanthipeptide [Roseivirga sp. BDSF3-8]|uniref:pinensin family lanthipeptide n=1 Tax=Roseivirga sp. BDSF3-8 TaxID=3241598 RepID=UPI0035323231
MKKDKLSLDQLNVKSFTTSAAARSRGGAYSDLCIPDGETVDYTACYGDRQCQIYDTAGMCQ